MTARRSAAFLLPAALALAACAAPSSTPRGAPAPARDDVAAAVATITPEDLYARIEFLAHDRMRGRNTPSPELDIVAAYLVNQHKLRGLRPAGEGGTFYQWYPFPLRRVAAAEARLSFTGARGTQALRAGRDFFTAGGTAADVSGGVVFVGRAEEGMGGEGSLRGHVAVDLLPGGYGRDFRTERNRLANAARAAGAAAVVHVLDPAWTADSIARYAEMAAQPTRSVGDDLAYPQFFVTAGAARSLFASAGLSVDEAAGRAKSGPSASVPLAGITAVAALPVARLDDARAPNVVAMLPGSDPVLRNEYVVISAHMDHVGVGRPVNGDSIYNGADDDASGTAALLEIAEAMASMPVAPRRTVVFLHVSGEEKGLLGSAWYANHPTLPLPQIVANINVDMIGRNAADSVVVIGKDYSTLGASVNRLNAAHRELGLTASDDIWPEQRFFFRSDHFNFARKEIPAIFFFTGVHEDYHRPGDEVHKIDTDKAARVTRLIFYLAHDVANATERPKWDPKGLAEVRRMTR